MSSCLNVEMFAEDHDMKIEFLAISVSEVTEAAQNQSPVSLFVPFLVLWRRRFCRGLGVGSR